MINEILQFEKPLSKNDLLASISQELKTEFTKVNLEEDGNQVNLTCQLETTGKPLYSVEGSLKINQKEDSTKLMVNMNLEPTLYFILVGPFTLILILFVGYAVSSGTNITFSHAFVAVVMFANVIFFFISIFSQRESVKKSFEKIFNNLKFKFG